MKDANIIEIINIIKKFNNEKFYIHSTNVNIFQLFDIELRNPDAAVAKCQRLHELFRSDFVSCIPLKYRFQYKCILDTLMPFIPYEREEVLTKLNIHLKKIKDYNERVKKMSDKEFFESTHYTVNGYVNSYKQFVKCNKENIKPRELNSYLRIMHMLIKRIKKMPINRQDNIYELFLILKNSKVESIRNSFWFDKLVNLSNCLVFDYYKEQYKAPDTDLKYFDKIIDLIVMMDNIYLDTEKTKKIYDAYLASIKVEKQNSKVNILSELEYNFYNLRKYNIIDLFNLFGFDSSFSSNDILNSEYYKNLENAFAYDINHENKVHVRLLNLFEEFNEVLKDDNLRKNYENLINRSKMVNDELVNNDYQEYKTYKFVIDLVIEKYKKMIENNIFIDYYSLFNLKQTDDIRILKRDMIILHKAFKTKFVIFMKDKESFVKVQELLNNFDNNIICSNKNRKIYDDKYNASKNIIIYKFKKKKYKIKRRYRNILLTYFRALESSLVRNGVEKTIELMSNYLYDGIGIEEKCFAKLAYSDVNKIEKTLIKAFGPENCIEETVKRSINYYINKKMNILGLSIDSTYKKKGCKQTKISLIYYMLSNNAVGFIPETDEEYGRENIEDSIRPGMIRILAGAKLDDYELLNSSLDDIDINNINDKIEALTDYLIQKNHPVLHKLHLLKK